MSSTLLAAGTFGGAMTAANLARAAESTYERRFAKEAKHTLTFGASGFNPQNLLIERAGALEFARDLEARTDGEIRVDFIGNNQICASCPALKKPSRASPIFTPPRPRTLPVIERYFERTIMVVSYLAIALIIFWGVIDRFIFSNQQPWSTTLPPLLFMIMAWFGASYNIRVRTHLSFSEFRTSMPRPAQLACLCLDCVLWFGFALILLVTTSRLVALSASNFQIVLGTDNTMQWWFLMAAPLAATLMAARAIENIQDDFANYRSGAPLIRQAVIGGQG